MRSLLSLCTMLLVFPTWACDACQKQQPKVLQGITHGTGPQSGWDMPIIVVSAIIVLVTLFFAVKFLVRPNENAPDHIKRSILNTPSHG